MSGTRQCSKSGDRCPRHKRATRAREPSPGATETTSAGMVYYKDSAAPAASSGDVNSTTNAIASTTNEQSSSFVNDTLPIVIVLSTLLLIAMVTLLCVYCHARRYRRREQLKSVSGVDSGSIPSPMLEVALDSPIARDDEPTQTLVPTQTPTPTPLPPTPPPSPQPPPRAVQVTAPPRQQPAVRRAQSQEHRYTISTLQIEPMTRRLTMDLNEPGRSVVVRNRDAQGTDYVVNVIPLREGPESRRQTPRVRLPCFG